MKRSQNRGYRHHASSAALLFALLGFAQEPAVSSPAESPAHPHWYLGAGLTQLNLRNDHPSIGSESGSGYYLAGGFQFFNRLSFELALATTDIAVARTCDPNLPQSCELIYYPADNAEYVALLYGVRLALPLVNHPDLQPWISTGYVYHSYSWDSYWYFVDGTAPFIGAGIDIGIGERWDVRFELNKSHYDSADNYGHGGYGGTTTLFNSALVYNFH